MRSGTRVALGCRREAVVNVRPSILCPIDFSEASVAALRHAAAIAEHFVARLIVLTVEASSSLAPSTGDAGTGREAAERESSRFVARAFCERPSAHALCEYDVATGKPATEILRVARERCCDLIVMSSHGRSGPRKWPLGSTTERVLRETSVPVLVIPAAGEGVVTLEDAVRSIERILVPVDLSPASAHQMRVARGLSESLGMPLTVVHVLEPTNGHVGLNRAGRDAARRADAEHAAGELAATMPGGCGQEVSIVDGDPGEAIAAVAGQRRAGLIVMGLHGGPLLEPRMGSVTYKTVCRSRSPVLALPPRRSAASRSGDPVPGAGFEAVAPKHA
jgi:nucleotide-binding universal stress UspA family protein